MKRFRLFLPLLVTVVLIGPAAGSAQAVSPTIVGATKTGGVKQIANINVAGSSRSLGYRSVTKRIGKPSRHKGGGSTCYSIYGGAGLTLLFISFGGARNCGQTWLQTATVWKSKWKVYVDSRVYRVGMPKSKTPRSAKRVRGFGYQVASMRSFGRRIGTVFLRFQGNRVSSILLWVGAAGD